MKKIRLLADWIDAVSRWIGEKASLLMIPLVLIAMMEVILRYVFNHPTIWAWDVNIQLAATLIVLAGPYTLLKGLFVRVDILVNHLPPKVSAWMDLILSVVPLFAAGILLKLAIRQAWVACVRGECLASTWMPPIYPLRIVVAAGFTLLFLQIISRVIRTYLVIIGVEAGTVSVREENK